MPSGGTNDGKEERTNSEDPNVISMWVENVKEMFGHFWKRDSEVKIIDGFPWKLRVLRDEDDICAEIICLKSAECEMWVCEVEGEIKLINQTDESFSICETLEAQLSFEEESVSVRLKSLNDLLENDDFVIDDTFEINAKIAVKQNDAHRFRNRRPIDFFSPSKISDVVLVVEGKKFHVSRQILAHAASYFETLFYGKFKESQEKEIELNDISADVFIIALELIYDSGYNVNDENVENLLSLAHLFDIPIIMGKCEKWLYKSTDLPFHTQLRLADQYNLGVLRAEQLGYIRSFDDVTVLKNSDSFKHYSAGLMADIIEKMIELRTSEGRD